MSDPIVYYYNKAFNINGVIVDNGTSTNNITDNGEYSGYSTFNGTTLNPPGLDKSLVFQYFGYRTPEGYDIPAYFTEVLNILKDDSFLVCTKTYVDSGSSSTTTVPFNTFVVTGASGIFEGYKQVKINYFPDFTRIVTITK
jgi:hypothetical protein